MKESRRACNESYLANRSLIRNGTIINTGYINLHGVSKILFHLSYQNRLVQQMTLYMAHTLTMFI
jgi:hypothetical protein